MHSPPTPLISLVSLVSPIPRALSAITSFLVSDISRSKLSNYNQHLDRYSNKGKCTIYRHHSSNLVFVPASIDAISSFKTGKVLSRALTMYTYGRCDTIW